MFVVGFNVSHRVALEHDHEEVIRAAKAAIRYIASRAYLDDDELILRLTSELRVFGEFHIEFVDPSGNDLEFPEDYEQVVIQISTKSALPPTIH